MEGFGLTVTPPAWQLALEKKSVALMLISQSAVARSHHERGAYCLRLSCPGDLKTRNKHKSGSLRTPCHGVCVGEGRKKEL
jgi:hypothetical protein